ncbi:hypothetical protein APT63_01085 [Pseudomonas sp. 22-AL-CL-001]|nr:hypothetical protein APT63_01085 [Pseudomonas monteilii]
MPQLWTTPAASCPVIELIQKSTSWEVHRDYQEAPENSILFKRREYMDGYIHGTLDALEIQLARVCCASARTRAVKRLTEGQAVKLKNLWTTFCCRSSLKNSSG